MGKIFKRTYHQRRHLNVYERCSSLLAFREMEIKSQRCHYAPISMSAMERLTIASKHEDVE